MNVLSAPRERRLTFREIAAVYLTLIVGSWAALAGVAFLVYYGLSRVWQ